MLGVNGAGLGLVVFETLSLLAVCYAASEYTGVDVRATLAEVFSKQSLATAFDSARSVFRDAGSRLTKPA